MSASRKLDIFEDNMRFLPVKFIIFSFVLFSTHYTYAGVSKQSIDLKESILKVELCREKALLKVGSREWPELISVDLKTFKQSTLGNLNPVGWFGCDEPTGNYYIVNIMPNAQTILQAYKEIGDKEPSWEKLIADHTGSFTDAHFRQAIVTNESIVVLKSYQPEWQGPLVSEVAAYNKTTGVQIWKFKVPNYIDPRDEQHIKMKAINNKLFITSANGYMQAYNLDSGSPAWEYRGNIHQEYLDPFLDVNSQTLITGLKSGSSSVEIIGIEPDTGKLKWTMDDYSKIIDLQIDPATSTLIYLQGSSPLYRLNGYQLAKGSNIEPSLIYQWKYKNDSQGLAGFIVAQDYLYVAVDSSIGDPSIFIFDHRGNKIDEIKPDNKSAIKINYSDFSKTVTYATFNGEFGIVNMHSGKLS